jgi:hypothetical protein
MLTVIKKVINKDARDERDAEGPCSGTSPDVQPERAGCSIRGY